MDIGRQLGAQRRELGLNIRRDLHGVAVGLLIDLNQDSILSIGCYACPPGSGFSADACDIAEAGHARGRAADHRRGNIPFGTRGVRGQDEQQFAVIFDATQTLQGDGT